jgi:hypothetical protein
MDIAREQTFYQLEVTANPHAQAFYESAGFTAMRWKVTSTQVNECTETFPETLCPRPELAAHDSCRCRAIVGTGDPTGTDNTG